MKTTTETLLRAYRAATEYPVTMSRQREDWLRQICAMPDAFGPEDVRAVIAGIKEHMRRGNPRYSQESLRFSNAMKPENFEERALLCREAAARKAARAARAAAGARPAPVAPTGPNVSLDAVRALRQQLAGGSDAGRAEVGL